MVWFYSLLQSVSEETRVAIFAPAVFLVVFAALGLALSVLFEHGLVLWVIGFHGNQG